MKKNQLTDLKVTHVSYVKKGANKKQFFLMKSDEDINFEKEIKVFINKADEEQKLVYGVVYEPNTIDSQGDFAKSADIEKAAHSFLSDARNIDLQHNFKSDYGTVVESYIAPLDFDIDDNIIKKGSWILVTKATDDIWDSIKRGEITGYSMAGRAVRTTIKDGIEKDATNISNDDEVSGFFNALKEFFHKGTKTEHIEKTGKSISGANMQKINAAIEALNQLKLLENNENNENEKSKEIKKEEIQEFLKSAINEALQPINKKLETMEAQYEKLKQKKDKNDKYNNDDSKDDINDTVKKAILEALEPINERVANIEKAKGISKQKHEDQNNQNIKKSVFSGIAI